MAPGPEAPEPDPARTTLPRAQLLRIAAAQRTRGQIPTAQAAGPAAPATASDRSNWRNCNTRRRGRGLEPIDLAEWQRRKAAGVPASIDGEGARQWAPPGTPLEERKRWWNCNVTRRKRALEPLGFEAWQLREREGRPTNHDGTGRFGFRERANAECSEAPANPCPKCGGPLGHTPYRVCRTCARRAKRHEDGAAWAAGATQEPETDL